VGGVWAYGDFLKALADPKHENHRDIKEWVGGRFDPEKFSVDKVKSRRSRTTGIPMNPNILGLIHRP